MKIVLPLKYFFLELISEICRTRDSIFSLDIEQSIYMFVSTVYTKPILGCMILHLEQEFAEVANCSMNN